MKSKLGDLDVTVISVLVRASPSMGLGSSACVGCMEALIPHGGSTAPLVSLEEALSLTGVARSLLRLPARRGTQCFTAENIPPAFKMGMLVFREIGRSELYQKSLSGGK